MLFPGLIRSWSQCISESRLIQTPQVCVRFSFNFRHWLILFHQPICHQPETRAVGHPCNPLATPLFLEMSVCRLLYHGIFILVCPNMLCTMSADSACVRTLWKLRQQRGLKMVLAYVTNVLVKMNMFQTRCMLFYFAKTIEFVSWGIIFLSVYTFFWGIFSSLTLFAATGQQPTCSWSLLSRALDFFFLSELMNLFVAGQNQSAADQSNNLAEDYLSLVLKGRLLQLVLTRPV